MQKAVLVVNDPLKRLLSTNVTFVGPVQQAPVSITAEILRKVSLSPLSKFVYGKMLLYKVF